MTARNSSHLAGEGEGLFDGLITKELSAVKTDFQATQTFGTACPKADKQWHLFSWRIAKRKCHCFGVLAEAVPITVHGNTEASFEPWSLKPDNSAVKSAPRTARKFLNSDAHQGGYSVAQISQVPVMSSRPNERPRKTVKHYDNGEPHFLTFSCYRRLPILSKDRSREWFVDALGEARALHGFHLWAWVIMPEHVHLLIWQPFSRISTDSKSTQGRIRGILSSIKRPVGERAIEYLREFVPDYLRSLTVINANRTYHRFWQSGSGYDEIVSDPSALHAVVEYVHHNPVRRGLVNRPEEWPWSSAREWSGLGDSAMKIDRTLPDKLEIPWSSR